MSGAVLSTKKRARLAVPKVNAVSLAFSLYQTPRFQ
jgi:hypothetical protein